MTTLGATLSTVEQTTVVRLSGDVTSTSASFGDVTGLSFAVAASKDYLFEFDIIHQSAAIGNGIGYGVNGPTTPTAVVGFWEAFITAGSATMSQFSAYDTGAIMSGVVAANANEPMHMRGIFRNGTTAGTFALRFRSENAGTTITVKAGSTLRYRLLN